jgi:uncharacterized repeat protein (TIGR01451 family)
MSRLNVQSIVMLLLTTGLSIPWAPPAIAQSYSSNAVAEVGHDTSPSLQSLANNVQDPQTCAQLPPQSLVNSTGLALDRNFCGFTPTGPLPGESGARASDNSGAAGPDHYFQTENFSAVIFDKSGQVVLGPFPTATFWNGFSSPNNTCSFTWSDVVVLYDHDAQRWFVSRFAAVKHSDDTTSWYQCFAVSTTTDPTGQYYRYVFAIDPRDWPDYPKFGIWPDAYYMTANNRHDAPPKTPTGAIGHFIVAFERSAMLAGQAAREIVFKIDNNGHLGHMLPADWDGKTPPPAGSPNYLARSLDTHLGWPVPEIEVWTAQVDWTAGSGVLNLQDMLPQTPFNSKICNLDPNCIPQPGTTQGLWPLAGEAMMYRLAYRNFGDHESLVFTQTVEAADFPDHVGIRWSELRKSGGGWSVYQQSTFAPDGVHRWMGSIAMDRFGNIAMGYNVSSSTIYPGIRIAGRLPSDPLNQMTEALILEPGLGSVSDQYAFSDYSQTTLDPLDDCTFWYAGTYLPANAINQAVYWATKIGSFRFPSCMADLSVTKTRSPSGNIEAGTNATYTVTVENNGPADAGNITLADTLAAGTGFVSVSAPAGWNCTTPLPGQSGPITCKATSLENGASAVFTIVASVNCSTPDATVIPNTAGVSAETPPDNSSGNDTQGISFAVFNPVPVVNTSVALGLLPQNDHELMNVGLEATATDGACPAPTTFMVQAFGDEDDQPLTESGGTKFSPDAKDIAVDTLRLRQERISNNDGRVYLIVVEATDTAGGTGFATTTVGVPKSSSTADVASVNAQAAAAKAAADSNQGAPPAGYFVVGDGPILGSKQ